MTRRWLDAHLDLAYLALAGRELTAPVADPDGGCVSLPALREAGVDMVFATVYTQPDAEASEPWCYPSSDHEEAAEAAGLAQIDVYRRLEDAGEITIIREPVDLHAADAARPAALLLMEGADPIRRPEDVPAWHERGVRAVGLTWARGTRYAGGNAGGGPLTPAGVEMVAALDEAGIIHDASHLSDAALEGLFAHARNLIVATHSNCRAVVGGASQRHLRDDQIAEIGRRGGVIGLNLYGRFLARDRPATVTDAVAHVRHVCLVMGHRRGAGLGSDMDGGFGPADLPEGLDHHNKLESLALALRNAGWSEEEVAAFARGNWQSAVSGAL